MGLSDKINRTLNSAMRKYVFSQYLRKSRKVGRKHPELFLPCDADLTAKHRALWGKCGDACGDRWLRLHVNLTGIQDYRFCPEDVFFGRIERILNHCDSAGHGIEDKNELWRYVPAGAEPETVCRYVRGAFCAADGAWMSYADVDRAIAQSEGDLVFKPSDSSGGNGVARFRKTGAVRKNDAGDILSAEYMARRGISSVLQRKIEQDAFSASFNPDSVNTVRMMTLRKPWSGEVVVARSMMRMGVSDAVVDNMMKGGLCVCLGPNGEFGKYAYDYDGQRYERHPVSKLEFAGLTHTSYGKMAELAKAIAAHVPDYNLLSFDFVPRSNGEICVVEINSTSQGITQLQYDFGGLFGDDSEAVMDWCARYAHLDNFKHFRTWY